MSFDKKKLVADYAGSGMEEAQAELLAENQVSMYEQLSTKKDLTDLQNGFRAEQTSLREEFDAKLSDATTALRREVNEQIQKTRLLIDDVQIDVRKTEAHLEGVMKTGFMGMDKKFNLLAFSNTVVVIFLTLFMAFLFRG
jgi:hypothetical protein